MKKFLVLLSILFSTTVIAHTIDWYVDGQIYQTTSCESGDNITPPTPPAKYGYTFTEWVPYKPIEYIESTGTQYIDTGINSVIDTEFEIVVQQTSLPDNGYPTIVGATDNTNPSKHKVIVGLDIETNVFYSQAGGSGHYVHGVAADLNQHTFNVNVESDKTTLTIDGTKTFVGYYATTDSETYSLMICARNGNTIGYFTNQKVFSFKVKKNGTLIQNLVPALDKNGIPCMFDKVSGTFFYNSGTGQFIAGPVLGGAE